MRDAGDADVHRVGRIKLMLDTTGWADGEEGVLLGEIGVGVVVGRAALRDDVAIVSGIVEGLEQRLHIVVIEVSRTFASRLVDRGVGIAILLGQSDEKVIVRIVSENRMIGLVGLQNLLVGSQRIVIGDDGGAEIVEEFFPGQIVKVILAEGPAFIDDVARHVEF